MEVVEPITHQFKVCVPGWCKQYVLKVGGEKVQPVIDKGYAVIPANGKPRATVDLLIESASYSNVHSLLNV